jgi:hypothetical protein
MIRRTLRHKMMKQGAHESKPGQYDRSFEKVVDKIEHSSPRMKLLNELGSGASVKEKDQWFADIPENDLKKQAQQDLWGKEGPTIADQRRSIMFDAEEWGQRVADTLQKAEKTRASQPPLDPKILKTTKESAEYYYPQQTLDEKRTRRGVAVAVTLVILLLFLNWLRKTLDAARTD